MATYTPPRPFFLPDAHLPNSASTPWTCRTCTSAWPCETAEPYLTESRCRCGSPTYWEKSKPRRWHTGPRCYSHADQMAALAEELHQYHQAHPHYPPSRPTPPSRRRRQRPPYARTPSGPGDIRPGTWLWVKPGGLHPAWADIHRLAMLTHLDRPYCEVWLDDTTVHRVRPHLLILERTPVVERGPRRRRHIPCVRQRSFAEAASPPVAMARLDARRAHSASRRRSRAAGRACAGGLFAA